MISEEMLGGLRKKVVEGMSEKRARHTLEVEKMVSRLASLYCPEMTNVLRGAALLHDITKEYKTDAQLELCQRYGIEVKTIDLFAAKTLHARTAAAIIPEEYPEFAHEDLILAVRYHTTGREGMTLGEKLLYLADYIDMSRTFPDCVRLRNFYFGAGPESMSDDERLRHLDDTLMMSYDMTVRGLLAECVPISEDTVKARNELAVSRLSRRKA